MKVLLVGTYPADRQYSILGFAKALNEGLAPFGIETRLVSPQEKLGKLGSFHPFIGRWLGHVDKVLLFSRELRAAAEWADVVHLVDHGLAIYVKHVSHKPHLVTCHDLIAMRAAFGDLPEWKIGGTAPTFQRMIQDGLNHAHFVACISQATKTQMERLTQLSAERMSIVYDSLFHVFEPLSKDKAAPLLREVGVEDKPFFIHLGRSVPTKNRLGVVKIFHGIRKQSGFEDYLLVLAGGPVSEDITAYIQQNGLEDAVLCRPDLSNEHLRALYSSAQALIFPSLHEGFGLPVIEAQACGCPVFASNRAPMTEVGGDSAVYFDPLDFDSAADIIATTLSQPGKREQMIAAGFENLVRFRPERMFQEYAELYKRLPSLPLPGKK